MATIKDLYEWTVRNNVEDIFYNVEDLPAGLQFQDDEDAYGGDTFSDMGTDYEISGEDTFVLVE